MSKNPVTYTAPHAVYVDQKLYATGETFTTAADPGEQWEKVSKAEKAAIDASQENRGDPPLESLGIEALRAVAVTHKVNPEGLSKKDLISAIKAADEPTL